MDSKLQCTSEYKGGRCKYEAGHKGKHHVGACSWTDAGLAALKADQDKAEAEQKASQ
jgi:hypothetical protein